VKSHAITSGAFRFLAAAVVQITIAPILITSSIANELITREINKGTGPAVEKGSRLTVHYVGLLTDGTVFDKSTEREPFIFRIGKGKVIEGWEIGLIGMRAGGIRRIFVPSEMAYGNKGVGSFIPPNSDLIFDVFLVNVNGVGGGQVDTSRGVPRGPNPDLERSKVPENKVPLLGETLSDTPFYW